MSRNVSELIQTPVDSPENEQKTGKKNSATQGQTGKSSNEMDKTISSRVGKSGPRGRKSANGTPSRGNASIFKPDMQQSAHTLTLESSVGLGTIAITSLADMMRYLRQEDYDTRNDIEKALNSMAQATAMKNEAHFEVDEARKVAERTKHTLEQFKMTALESHERALALFEEAKREKQEAVEAREEALRITNRLIEEQNLRSEVGSDACGL